MNKITKKCQEMSRMHAEIIEAQIAEAISETGCNINDLTLEIQCNTKFKVLLKIKEFEINMVF